MLNSACYREFLFALIAPKEAHRIASHILLCTKTPSEDFQKDSPALNGKCKCSFYNVGLTSACSVVERLVVYASTRIEFQAPTPIAVAVSRQGRVRKRLRCYAAGSSFA